MVHSAREARGTTRDTRFAPALVVPAELTDHQPTHCRAQGYLLHHRLDRAAGSVLPPPVRSGHPPGGWAESRDSESVSSRHPYRLLPSLVQFDRGQMCFDLLAHWLIRFGDAKCLPQALDRFIDQEAGIVRGHFEQHSTGLTKINGVEVTSVLNRGDAEIRGENLAPFGLSRIVNVAESNVVHRACAHAAHRSSRIE